MTPKQVNTLKAALEKAFEAEVEAEKVADKRYRFSVVSPKFAKMSQLKRQDAVWNEVDKVLSKEDALGVSLILAYAPEELEQPV